MVYVYFAILHLFTYTTSAQLYVYSNPPKVSYGVASPGMRLYEYCHSWPRY